MSSGVELLHTIVSVLLKYLLSHLTVPQKTRNLKSTFISTSFGSCEFSGVCKTEKKKNGGYCLRHWLLLCQWEVEHQKLGHQLFVRVNRMKKVYYCSKGGYHYLLDNSNHFDSAYLLDCGLCSG